MRKKFADLLYKKMKKNTNIWLVSGDMGYGIWDQIKQNFPDRFINVGAAEQTMMGVAIGLATQGKIPIVYSITPFLLYRPFETIRNYINQESIPVKLIGSGRNQEYSNEGFSHWANEDGQVMKLFPNITSYWPKNNQQLEAIFPHLITTNKPFYVNLLRKPQKEQGVQD